MKSIAIGIAGCGIAGKGHLQGFFQAGGSRAWVWDIRPEAAQALAQPGKIEPLATFEEMLEQPEIKAIIIATPNRFHAPLAIRALEAGKDVLLEKPMGLNAEEAEAVVATAERLGRRVHVGFELRQSTFPLLVRELIENGELGPLISGHIIHFRGHFWPAWKGTLESGGSLFLMEDCHAIDLFRWWSGSEVEKVHAVGVRKNIVEHYEYPDTHFATYVFRNGFVAHISDCHVRSAIPEDGSNWLEEQFGHQYEYTLVGENGSLHFIPLKQVCRIYRHVKKEDGRIVQELTRTVEFPNFTEAIHNGGAQMTEFLKMIQGERGPLIDPCDALQTHLVCYASEEARQKEEPVAPKSVYCHEV